MCGILLHRRDGLKKEEFLKSLNRLSHRGPDNISHLIYKDIHIGHLRLSIIDINNRSNQPMISECDKYILSYNGEIYNFKELKSDLIKKGLNFKTNSDTEVLLNGFKFYGKEILEKLN